MEISLVFYLTTLLPCLMPFLFDSHTFSKTFAAASHFGIIVWLLWKGAGRGGPHQVMWKGGCKMWKNFFLKIKTLELLLYNWFLSTDPNSQEKYDVSKAIPSNQRIWCYEIVEYENAMKLFDRCGNFLKLWTVLANCDVNNTQSLWSVWQIFGFLAWLIKALLVR